MTARDTTPRDMTDGDLTRLSEDPAPTAAKRSLDAPDRPACAAAPEAVRSVVPAEALALLDEDETIILLIQPSLWFIPLSCLGSLAAIAFMSLVMAWSARFSFVPWSDVQSFSLGAVLATARLSWQALEWSQRLYVLTDRRIIKRSGTLRTRVDSAKLREIRHTVVLAAPRERLVNVGTVMFATAFGIFGHMWEAVRRPHEVSTIVREAVDRYG